MAVSENAGHPSQLISTLITLMTFIGGYFLGVFEKFRERRRNIRNLKIILFKEISDNYKKLNPFVPADLQFHPNLVQVPAASGTAISTVVYDAYLSRLADLKSFDLEKIFDAYHYLNIYKSACKAFLDMKSEELDVLTSVEAKVKIESFLQCMRSTHSNTEKALAVFEDGKKFLSEEGKNRGCEYNRIFEIAKSAAQQIDASKRPH